MFCSHKQILKIRKKVKDFFFYVYDSETDTTVPVPVEELAIEDEQELEFIYDDKRYSYRRWLDCRKRQKAA